MQPALSLSHSDDAFFRKRQAMLVFPWIVIPFVYALFWILGGGKGDRYTDQQAAANKPGATGFNAEMPTAKNGKINGRNIETPGYGKAAVGQVLSTFTHTKADSATRGLNPVPVSQNTFPSEHRSSLTSSAVYPNQTVSGRVATTTAYGPVKARRAGRSRTPATYYYNAPGQAGPINDPYGRGSDRQLDEQLKAYENNRVASTAPAYVAPTARTIPTETPTATTPATVRLSDNLTASRLSETEEAASPFLTAPTGGNRTEPTRAVLSGGNYSQKKVIAWMIPVVVHEDQTIKDGQQVKLRLLKEITVDGVTVPVNTVLYASCQLSNDRLRLTVHNLQLHGQLIPLDLDVYDTDGSPGVNVPGLSQSSQINGQLRSSAIQGAQVPGLGGLANTVLSSARMGASQSARQTTIRLRSGYNLYLKAQ